MRYVIYISEIRVSKMLMCIFVMTVSHCEIVGTILFIDICRQNFALRKTLKLETNFLIFVMFKIDTEYGRTICNRF